MSDLIETLRAGRSWEIEAANEIERLKADLQIEVKLSNESRDREEQLREEVAALKAELAEAQSLIGFLNEHCDAAWDLVDADPEQLERIKNLVAKAQPAESEPVLCEGSFAPEFVRQNKPIYATSQPASEPVAGYIAKLMYSKMEDRFVVLDNHTPISDGDLFYANPQPSAEVDRILTEDNIESLWRKVTNTSADHCPMEFVKALIATMKNGGA